jgi:thiamine transport system substrate-binding protein
MKAASPPRKHPLSLPRSSSALALLVSLLVFPARAADKAPQAPSGVYDVSILTYDSFVAKGGLGPEIIPLFEKSSGCKARATGAGDGGQLLNRLELDAKRGAVPEAQVVVGIDQQLWEDARAFAEPWGEWTPRGYGKLLKDTRVEKGFLPFDYGTLAFMADTEALRKAKLQPPASLEDLLKPEWKRNLVLQDPRTSTPGLALVRYTVAVYGEAGWQGYWKKLRPQWLTLAQGWDAAYGIFLKGEAPLVWSYTTSQAYHAEHGDQAGRYKAIHFKEGQPVQIEGAILVKGAFQGERAARKRECARKFLEFLISPETQKRVPKTNWMLPVLSGVELPKSFRDLPRARKLVRLPLKGNAPSVLLPKWSQAVEAGP